MRGFNAVSRPFTLRKRRNWPSRRRKALMHFIRPGSLWPLFLSSHMNRVIRKSIKTRGSFPTGEAATRLIYLAIRNFGKGGRNVREWREWFAARNRFAIMFEDRFNA